MHDGLDVKRGIGEKTANLSIREMVLVPFLKLDSLQNPEKGQKASIEITEELSKQFQNSLKFDAMIAKTSNYIDWQNIFAYFRINFNVLIFRPSALTT